MRKNIFIAALALGSSVAVADTVSNSYAGVGLGLAKNEIDGFQEEFEFPIFNLRAGTKFTDNVGLEFRLGMTGEDTITESGIEVDYKVKNYFGAYLLGYVPINDHFELYGLIGKTRGKAEVTIEAFGFKDTESETDTSFGLGAQYWDTKEAGATGFGVEYVNYFDDDSENISGLSLTLTKKF